MRGVAQSGHTVSTVRQPDQSTIEIWHNTEAGTEWLSLEQEDSVGEINSINIGLAGLGDLIKELQRLKSFYGTPNLEAPSYSTGSRR